MSIYRSTFMKKSFVVAVSLAATFPAVAAETANNAFNPALSLILSGQASYFSKNPSSYSIPGFVLGDEAELGDEGLALSESEITLSSNVDDQFYGQFTVSIAPNNETSVEEAYLQTLDLPSGLTVRFGRLKSGIGYLNSQHAHTWDFTDAPLAYRALLNNQFADDGVRFTWLAPTDIFLELGSELFRGDAFPAANADHHGAGAYTVYGHMGGDVGVSHAWQAGLSHLEAHAQDREASELIFSGDNQINVADFVWKWSSNGNPKDRYFKFQAEYLWGSERGHYTDLGNIDVSHSGWYAQIVYQFIPRWRLGVRYDVVHSDLPSASFYGSVLDPAGVNSHRLSAMLDFSNSEFSRLRLQLNRDESSSEASNQVFLQYQMSLGAHGAHSF